MKRYITLLAFLLMLAMYYSDGKEVVAATPLPTPATIWTSGPSATFSPSKNFICWGDRIGDTIGPVVVKFHSKQPSMTMVFVGCEYAPFVSAEQRADWALNTYGRYFAFEDVGVPTATPTLTASSTRTKTNTPTQTRTPSVTLTPSATGTPTKTPTRTYTRTRTLTGTPSNTRTPVPPTPTSYRGIRSVVVNWSSNGKTVKIVPRYRWTCWGTINGVKDVVIFYRTDYSYPESINGACQIKNVYDITQIWNYWQFKTGRKWTQMSLP